MCAQVPLRDSEECTYLSKSSTSELPHSLVEIDEISKNSVKIQQKFGKTSAKFGKTPS